jgi:cell cycle checkpoint protein
MCKADSTDVIITLLQTLLLEKDQQATCTIIKQGLKFSVEKTKTLRAKAYVKSSVFTEFELNEDNLEFTLNLSILLQCLQIFGQQSHLHMSYAGYGHPLALILEEDGVITQCEIKTLEAEAPIDFNFRSSAIISRAVVKSQFLRDCFAELDVPGASKVTVHMSPEAPFLSMSVEGDSSSCKVDFPSDKEAEVFTEFEAKSATSNTYPLSLIRPCAKALAKSDHTNLRINEGGMWSMQHVIPANDGTLTNWVEFLICPHVKDDASD